MILAAGLEIACEDEARRRFPLETGGAFMGRRTAEGDFLIEHMIGPGPRADHRRRSFKPDAAWQWSEMARLHLLTTGRTTYLGDWHTHPRCGGGDLSARDVAALREILRDSRSCAASVLCAILSGGRRRWSWTIHLASPGGLSILTRA